MIMMNKTKIIKITADDYGYCPQRNKGIRELAKLGIIHKTSVLVNTEFVETNIAGEDVTLGLHLNLTEGIPVSHGGEVKSITGRGSMFLGKHGFREKLKKDLVVESEVKQECTAQIERFIALFGYIPSYIDGHQHVHILPMIRRVVGECMRKYNIKETRLPYEFAIEECTWIEQVRLNFYIDVCADAKEAAKEWEETHDIRFPRYFIGLSTMSRDLTLSNLNRALDLVSDDIKKRRDIGTNTLEIMCHPGYPSNGTTGGCGDGPDEFSCSNDRLYELDFLKSKEFSDALEPFERQLTS